MGFVDRGGGREAKGASLRRSKKNPGAPAARKASALKQQSQPATRVLPTPPPFSEERQHIDAAVAILARRLETDRDVLMRRAAQESGVAAALTWCADFGRQEALVEFCRQHNNTVSTAAALDDGVLYCLVGVHVNNVDRMHKKLQETWVENVTSWGRHPEVLGVFSGLDFSRDSGTHFAQEWLLEQLWCVAGSLQLPFVLHIGHDGCGGEGRADVAGYNLTVDRAADLLADLMTREEGNADDNDDNGQRRKRKKKPTAIVLYNGLGAVASSLAMRTLVRRYAPSSTSSLGPFGDEGEGTTTASGADVMPTPPHIYVLVTAQGLTKGCSTRLAGDCDTAVDDITPCNSLFVEALRNHVSSSQLLIGTGSPWNTPQNIPDEHMCKMPNEPANYRYVVSAVFDALRGESQGHPKGLHELCTTARENFLRVFFNAENYSRCEGNEGQEDEGVPNEVKGGDAELDGTRKSQTVHFDFLVTTPTDAVRVAPDSMRYYLCLKCRRRLFHEHRVLTHPPDTARAHFGARHARSDHKASRMAALGVSCESVSFLPLVDGPDGEWGVEESGLDVNRLNGTVTCGGCGAKLGTAGSDLCCPCGCIISGLTARLAASKFEAPVGRAVGGDLDELLVQAERERQQLLQEELASARRDGAEEGGERKRKDPKKNVKANNRSNFTHFRNKNFAPRRQLQSGHAPAGGDARSQRDSDGGEEGEEESEILQQAGRCPNRRRRARQKGE